MLNYIKGAKARAATHNDYKTEPSEKPPCFKKTRGGEMPLILGNEKRKQPGKNELLLVWSGLRVNEAKTIDNRF